MRALLLGPVDDPTQHALKPVYPRRQAMRIYRLVNITVEGCNGGFELVDVHAESYKLSL